MPGGVGDEYSVVFLVAGETAAVFVLPLHSEIRVAPGSCAGESPAPTQAHLHSKVGITYRMYRLKSWSFTISASMWRTSAVSTLNCSPFLAGASKLISSSTRSM